MFLGGKERYQQHEIGQEEKSFNFRRSYIFQLECQINGFQIAEHLGKQIIHSFFFKNVSLVFYHGYRLNHQTANGTKHSKMYQVEFVEEICLSRPHHFNFFKGCLPQISLGPFLNTSSQTIIFFASKPLVSYYY